MYRWYMTINETQLFIFWFENAKKKCMYTTIQMLGVSTVRLLKCF